MIVNRKGEGWLPVGLSDYVRLKHAVLKDAPIRWSDVEILEDNFLVELYHKQKTLLKCGRQPHMVESLGVPSLRGGL